MTGQTVSHYRILEKLGEGGMGAVYKAEDTKLRRTVALKFLPEKALDDPETRARFLHEAQAAAALSHPNVCTVFEIEDEHGFLAMEYIDGETVQQKVGRRPFPLVEALQIAIQAGQGLNAAHERGIVHRDIKSSNLMVTAEGLVKILDFGLARLSGQTRLTRTSAVLGTAAYMSPEQILGEQVDCRTDIWSLGIVLYEMLAGKQPFRGEVEQAFGYSIVHETPEPLTALRTGLPMEMDRVCEKTLAKDREQRYQHVDELLVDLKALLNTAEVTRVPTFPGRLPVSAASARAKRQAITAGGAGLILGGCLTGMLAWNYLHRPLPLSVTRFSIPLPNGEFIPASFNNCVALSPDGLELAYRTESPGGVTFRLRNMSRLEARTLGEKRGSSDFGVAEIVGRPGPGCASAGANCGSEAFSV